MTLEKPDGILYINLDSREDRRTQIEHEIESYLATVGDVPVVRVPGSVPVVRVPGSLMTRHGSTSLLGALGCTNSHRKAMTCIREKGWKTALVLEDDFVWLGDIAHHAATRIDWFLKDPDLGKSDHWGFVQIAHSPESFREHRPSAYAVDLHRVTSAGNASGYIVNQESAAKLEALWTKAVTAMLHGGSDATYICDVMWDRLRRELPCYAFVPRLGRQSAGFSDLQGRHTDYL